MDPRLNARYQSAAGAAAYRRKYERSWVRRLSHRREMRVVRRALARAGAAGVLLDVPCGAGRLLPLLLEVGQEVIAADLSAAMVAEARAALEADARRGRVRFCVAPAHALPLADGAVDTALCHRLLHHLGEPGERAAVLRELARVARRRVVLSFSDETTFKSRWQRRRGVRRVRHVLAPRALDAEAAAHGLVPVGRPIRLNGLTSLLAVAVYARADAAP